MSKNTETLCVSIPKDRNDDILRIMDDTGLTKSAVVTALVSLAIKWDLVKEALENDKTT